ncbi:hypothetical protein FRC10_003148 [Ceratobasidium sp. 414]|nr:hypothetical protein FRC10_003148 [Ceratobasidium sp. 414]
MVDVSTKPGFRWCIPDPPAPLVFTVKIKDAEQTVELVEWLEHDKTPGVSYLQLPSLFQDYVVRLNDLRTRVDDSTWEKTLKNDITGGALCNCSCWTPTGEEVSGAEFLESRLGRTLRRGDIEAYRSQWITCFDNAIQMTNNRPGPLGKFDVLSRFYQPKDNKIFDLYFMPGSGGAFTTNNLKSVLTNPALQNRGVSGHVLNMSERKAEQEGYVKLSTNPLRLYTTWMLESSLRQLVETSTEARYWTRPMPDAGLARDFNRRLLNTPSLGLKHDSLRIVDNSMPYLLYPGGRLVHFPRLNTKKIMGDSANSWAIDKLEWAQKGAETCAEWLHLIAHRFDPRTGDRFGNLIFGTKECNTDMMRAEAVVTQLLQSVKVYAVGIRTKVRHDLKKLEIKDEDRPREEDITWMKSQPNMSAMDPHPHWLTAQLEYTIQYYLPVKKGYVKCESTSIFSPFSRRCPFRYEYELDKILLKEYLKNFQELDALDISKAFRDIVHQLYGIKGRIDPPEEELESESEADSEEELPDWYLEDDDEDETVTNMVHVFDEKTGGFVRVGRTQVPRARPLDNEDTKKRGGRAEKKGKRKLKKKQAKNL